DGHLIDRQTGVGRQYQGKNQDQGPDGGGAADRDQPDDRRDDQRRQDRPVDLGGGARHHQDVALPGGRVGKRRDEQQRRGDDGREQPPPQSTATGDRPDQRGQGERRKVEVVREGEPDQQRAHGENLLAGAMQRPREDSRQQRDQGEREHLVGEVAGEHRDQVAEEQIGSDRCEDERQGERRDAGASDPADGPQHGQDQERKG